MNAVISRVVRLRAVRIACIVVLMGWMVVYAVPSASRNAHRFPFLGKANGGMPSSAMTQSVSSLSASSSQATGAAPTDVTVVTTDPNLLVLNAVRQAVWGPPVTCKVYQSSKAYGQQSILSGDYKSAGLGTLQFRYSTRMSIGETTQDLLQVSDGRMMYTQVGLDQPPRRVIVQQVKESLSYAIQYADSHPEVNLYLAIGGQAELLRGLYHRYHWYKAVGGKLNGVDVWQLVGRIRSEVPKIVGHTALDESNTKLGGLPSTLPTEVRLTLSRSANLAYFPYKIEYIQTKRDSNGQVIGIELVSEVTFSEPSTSVSLSDTDFNYRVSDSIEKIDDETKLYLPTSPIAGLTPFPIR